MTTWVSCCYQLGFDHLHFSSQFALMLFNKLTQKNSQNRNCSEFHKLLNNVLALNTSFMTTLALHFDWPMYFLFFSLIRENKGLLLTAFNWEKKYFTLENNLVGDNVTMPIKQQYSIPDLDEITLYYCKLWSSHIL